MDGSQVYGSDDQLAERLRDPRNRKFLDVRPFVNFGDQKILPPDPEAFCRSTNLVDRPCFIAGDIRVNENQGNIHVGQLGQRAKMTGTHS